MPKVAKLKKTCPNCHIEINLQYTAKQLEELSKQITPVPEIPEIKPKIVTPVHKPITVKNPPQK